MNQASPRRAALRHVLHLVLALLLVVTASACGGDKAAAPKPSKPTASASGPPVDPAVVVTGLPEGVDFQVIDTSVGTENGDNLDFVSPVYSLALTGTIDQPVTARLQLDNAQPVATPIVVATRVSATQPWSYQAGRLTSDLLHVDYRTKTLNQVGVLAMDLGGALAALQRDVSAGLRSGIDKSVERPTCDGTDLARKDGYSAAATKSPTLFWCFGKEKGKPVVKVTNRRIVPLQIVHPKVPVVQKPPTESTYEAWPDVLAASNTFLPPSDTVVYDVTLEPKSQLVLTGLYGADGQSLRLLQAAVRAFVIRLGRFGAGSANAIKTVGALLAMPQCARSIGKGSDALSAGCFSYRKLVKVFGPRAVLLRPLVADSKFRSFLRAQAQALVVAEQSEQKRITVKRAAADFSIFSGVWTGHTRLLTVNGKGVTTEKLSDGCCDLVIRLTYQLADPLTRGNTSTATATVTRVTVRNRNQLNGRVPQVGDKGRLTLRNGVITPPFLKTNYCNKAAARNGTCGA